MGIRIDGKAIAAAVRAGRLETGKHNGHVVYRVTVP